MPRPLRTKLPPALAALTGPVVKRATRAQRIVKRGESVVSPPRIYRMEIPGWRPSLANQFAGRHWSVGSRLKSRDVDIIARAMMVCRVPPATGPRRVRFEINMPRGRFPDPDGPLKAGLDALSRAGAIVDDSAEWCRWEVPAFGRGPKGTVIELEEIA